jgi:surface antigen
MTGIRKILLTFAVVGLTVTSFAEQAHAGGEGQFFGTITGGAIGGLVGNQFGHGDGRVLTTTAGVLAGGLIGNSVGASMDRQDAYNARPAYAYAPEYAPAPVYYATSYVPNYVAPPAAPVESSTALYDEQQGSYCREYTQELRVGNQVREAYGTACLQPDGTWRVVP